MTFETNECTGAISTATFGTSATAKLAPNTKAELIEKILFDIQVSIYCSNVII